ncbi:MAG: hypothetical protein ACOY0T_06050 [Myxococcota bacterium]
MRYRAVAVPSPDSNAVGTVELECTPHGLFVAYLGVGAFRDGYAPGALAEGTGLTAPWSQVSEARVEGDRVFVAFDQRFSPLNRLTLTRFESGHALPAEELAKRRLVVRIASVGAAIVAALIIGAWLVRSSAESSAGAAIGLAMLVALALLAVGFFVDQSLAASGDEARAQQNFATELGHYLPTLVHQPRSAPPPPKLPDISELQGLLPRTTVAIVITLTAGALGVLLVARWVTTNEGAVSRVTNRVLAPPTPEPPQTKPAAHAARPEPSTAATTPPLAPPSDGSVTLRGECRCAHPDSALWADPIPRLSVLTLAQRVRMGRNPDESKRKKYVELDVAVVNNSNKELDEVALLVLFYERDPPPSNKRTQVSNRPLFFEGPLLPGQAIKWSVEAEGTEFEIQNPITGTIGPNGEDAAPTNRIAELLSAHNRPVRLHGAMLLAFLGDPRAKEGVLALREALRDDEAPYLTRLIQSLADVRVCDLRVNRRSGDKAQVSACLHNVSKEARRDLGVKIRGLERAVSVDSPLAEPPTVLTEATIGIPSEIPPDSGRGIHFALDLEGKSPTVYEAFADRYDLLR